MHDFTINVLTMRWKQSHFYRHSIMIAQLSKHLPIHFELLDLHCILVHFDKLYIFFILLVLFHKLYQIVQRLRNVLFFFQSQDHFFRPGLAIDYFLFCEGDRMLELWKILDIINKIVFSLEQLEHSLVFIVGSVSIDGPVVIEILQITVIKSNRDIILQSIDIQVSCQHDQIVGILFVFFDGLFDHVV